MVISHIERTKHITKIFAEVCSYVKLCNRMGYFDANLFMEDLVLLLLNATFGYQLENINHKIDKNNVKSIDLIDESNKICVQVSSRTDIAKIKHALKGVVETKALSGFRLMYFALTDESPKRKTSELRDCGNIFSFSKDYFDFSRVIKIINSKPDISCKVYDILSNWIGDTPIDIFEKKYRISDIENLERYYSRTVSVPAENDYDAYFQKDKYPSNTLYNFVSGKVSGFEENKLWLLVSAAQVGKSYEAINLYHRLRSDETNYPILIQARDFRDENNLVLPFYAPIHKITLIIDGFDELPESRRNALYRLIENTKRSSPELKIVVTCRRNYVNLCMFADFQRLNLDDLSIGDIEVITERNAIDFNSFSKELTRQHLWELVFVPFFLESLLAIYKKDGCLPTKKLEVIKAIVSESYATDDLINPAINIPSETYGNTMLKKIAWVLQLSEKKELTETELTEVFKYDTDEISRCLRFAIFKRSEDKRYSFTRNIFLNYFVVLTLLEMTADEILNLVVLRDAAYSCINPAWLDAFELLISSLDNRSDKYRMLVEWMFVHDQGNIISLDSQNLPKEVVTSTFKDLLMKYKQLGISGPNDYNYNFHKKLASHCIYHESLELLISEYELTNIEGRYGYLLASMTEFIDSDIILASDLYPEYVNVILGNIKKNAYSDNNEWYIYIPLENKIFHNIKTVDFLINLYTLTNIVLLNAIFTVISKLDYVDSYIDFVSDNLDAYTGYTDCYGVHHPMDDELIDLVFSKIKNTNNLHIAMNCMVSRWIKKRGGISSEEKAYKSFINLLNVVSRYADKNADLIELVEACWQKLLIKRVFSGQLLLSVFNAVKEFVVKYCKTDKSHAIIQNMRDCLKNENCGLELRAYRAVLLLYLSLDETDEIVSRMECSEDNAIILNWMKSGLVRDIDEKINYWLNTKFMQFNFHQAIDWEKHKKDSERVLVDHRLFISTIKALLEKSGGVLISQYLDDLENRDMPINTHIYMFCKYVEDDLKVEYSSEKLIERAQCKRLYDNFRINILGDLQDSIELSDEQRDDLENAVCKEIENQGKSIVMYLKVAMRYRIELPENIILQNLKYAALTFDKYREVNSENNFLAYAIKYLDRKKINYSVQSLIESSDPDFDKYHMLQLMIYAIKERLFICIPQILKIICAPGFYYSYKIIDTLNSIGVKGIHIIKDNFKSFPSELQIYSLKYIIEYDDMQGEIICCLEKIRVNGSDEYSRMALYYLLSIGHKDSLIALLDICKFNPSFLGDFQNAPSLKYSLIEYLPTLIDILRISNGFASRLNQWPSQCVKAIKTIALSKDENTDIVINALRDLVSESPDLRWLNYQIESIQQGRLQRHSNPFSVKDACMLIDGGSYSSV